MIKTWEELEEKYRNEERHLMTTEREREFVNDCFECYENEGFNKVFWSPYHGNEKYKGKTFKVLGRTTEKECELEWQPVWRIQFSDGKIINAFPEEIIASEMKQFNKCPKEYLNKKENDNMVKTWEELEKKYEEERETMSTEREREYVNDLANCYENEGLNKVFWSPFNNEGETQYYGKPFKVLGRCPENRNNLRILPLWDIEFEDGNQLTVEHYEIFTKSMADMDCPKNFLIPLQEEIDCLYEQLMEKLQKEMQDYKEKLQDMTVDEVINEAYKFTMLKEFVKCFEVFSKDYLTNEQFKNLLNVKDNLLEILYNDWINYDSEEQSIYKEFIFGYWNWEELEAN
jgi:hypothetical protein